MIQQGQCDLFKADLYRGVHALESDVLMLALYTGAANLGPSTTVYTPTGEVTGGGYVAGGKPVYGATVAYSGGTSWVSFNNVTWLQGGFTARGALLYNASKSNKAIAVLDFGLDRSAGDIFVVQFPAGTATTALIRTATAT